VGDFIRANLRARLAIIYQTVVATGQLQLQLLSANIVSDVDTKRLGTGSNRRGLKYRTLYTGYGPPYWTGASQNFGVPERGQVQFVCTDEDRHQDAALRPDKGIETIQQGDG
jgi:hypothetical protein